jgi:hypothetical protein
VQVECKDLSIEDCYRKAQALQQGMRQAPQSAARPEEQTRGPQQWLQKAFAFAQPAQQPREQQQGPRTPAAPTTRPDQLAEALPPQATPLSAVQPATVATGAKIEARGRVVQAPTVVKVRPGAEAQVKTDVQKLGHDSLAYAFDGSPAVYVATGPGVVDKLQGPNQRRESEPKVGEAILVDGKLARIQWVKNALDSSGERSELGMQIGAFAGAAVSIAGGAISGTFFGAYIGLCVAIPAALIGLGVGLMVAKAMGEKPANADAIRLLRSNAAVD